MEISKTQISALIFDAGDVLVHKIPDNQIKAWNDISFLFQNSKIEKQKLFTLGYDQIRSIGSDYKFDYIKIDSFLIKLALFEEYETKKWWINPDPKAFESISQLRQIGFKIGILTDSVLPSNTIRKVIGPLSTLVNEIVSSRDVGVMKPDQQMYYTILSQLKMQPDKAVFIAHDPDEIKGALKLGLNCEDFEAIGNLRKLVERIKRKYVLAK